MKKKDALKQYDTITLSMVSIPGGELLSGDSAGGLHFWVKAVAGGSIKYKKNILSQERGPVSVLKLWAEGWVSASANCVKMWNFKKEVVREIATEQILTKVNRFNSAGLHRPDSSFVRSVDIDSPGMRLLVFFSFSLLVEVSVDTVDSTIISEGSPSPVTAIASCNDIDDSFVVITGHEDMVVRAWDIKNPKGVVGYLPISTIPNAIIYLTHDVIIIGENSKILIVKLSNNAVVIDNSDADISRQANHHQIDKRVMSISFVVTKELNTGKGDVTSVKVSDDRKVMAVGSSDGGVYFFSINEDETVGESVSLIPIGSVAPFPATGGSCPVSAIDFSACSKFIRIFSANFGYKHKIVVIYYELYQEDKSGELHTDVTKGGDPVAKKTGSWLANINVPSLNKKEVKEFKPVANIIFKPEKVVDPEKLQPLRQMKWASVSSPAAPEASFTMTTAITPRNIVTTLVNEKRMMCVGYNDGSVVLFKNADPGYTPLKSLQLFTNPLYAATSSPLRRLLLLQLEGVHLCMVGGRFLVAIGHVDSYFAVVDLDAN